MKLTTSCVLSLSLLTIACQSTANYPDASADIQKLTEQKNEIVMEQENILAPEEYEKFDKALNSASSINAKHEDASDEVKAAKSAANEIHERSKASKALLAEVLVARRKAIDAGGGDSVEFKKTDKDLVSITSDAAAGDIKDVQKQKNEFQNLYLDAEENSIVFKTMGGEKKRLAEMKENKVEKTAPLTFKRVTEKLGASEREIRADRANPQTLGNSQLVAKAELARLEKISSDAERLKNEPAAIEMYEKEQAANAQKAELERQQAVLSQQNSRLSKSLSSEVKENSETAAELASAQGALASEQSKALSQAELEKKYTDARKLFNEKEADVYKDGAHLLIRLKGISFTNGKGQLPATSQALMTKLGSVVSNFNSANIRIEGHTDSRGSTATNSKLSQERADSVKEYLVAHNIVTSNKIVAQGMGEDAPLATNDTTSGRAQNRRVDVIVQPE